MVLGESIRDQVFFVIRDNPGILRTEVQPKVGKPINVVTPAIKELIDAGMVVEGPLRASRTTGKNGHTLYIAGEWAEELNCQNKLWP